MKTFNMYVKTVIYNEQNKILLLKQKREDEKQQWDLPGATFTEEQSFDETVITNVQKEIGYYVYPGKIIGIADYTSKTEKEVHVIMEGSILNGELLLSKDYETYTWVNIERIKDYPLVPWLNNYMNNNKYPFEDVENEIEELTNKTRRRREVIQEDILNSIQTEETSEKLNNEVKSSFSLLKDTIIRTFHPREAKVTQTTPKSNELYQETEEKKEEKRKESIADKLNIRRKKVEEEENLEEIILQSHDDDIIIEHDTPEQEEEIIIDHNIPEERHEVKKINDIEESPTQQKFFDMNVNKQENMKKVEKKSEPKIQIIHKDEETPHIRKEKDSKKVSFNSDNISAWKERLNKINRTEANDEKKNIPQPKGKRR